MMIRTTVLLTLLMAFLTVDGQGLHGKVYGENGNGVKETLVGAILVWEGTRSGTATNIDGHFSIGIPSNSTKLIVSFVGYLNDTIQYVDQTELSITLRLNTLSNVVNVRGELGATHISMRNPQNFQTLTEKELCKAACCNLSESFETNASIDATFADAVTGAKQIRMLGLDGKYTQMMFDNIPAIRGLASTYGFTYVPGPWIKSIHIAKGVGSVTSGYESITGQINVAMKNPENTDKLHVNGYAAMGGRMELNVIFRPGPSKEEGSNNKLPAPEPRIKFKPIFLAHASISQMRTDMNGDGFLDNPLFNNLILRNEWQLTTKGGLGGQYTANYLRMTGVSGTLDYNPTDEVRSRLWGVNLTTDRYDFSGKTGYVFEEKPWKSFGSQVSASWHDQKGNYGYRNYSGQQLSARVNLLFATRIINDSHKITSGVSYVYDDYVESITYGAIPPVTLSSFQLNRTESVPGIFTEYTLNVKDKMTAVVGLRGDHHNIYGAFITPRLHARYSFTDNTSLKLISGLGYRTANLIMDNVGILASNRDIVMGGKDPNGIYGMKMEQAWNSGLIFTHKFKLNNREGTISLDGYHTNFVNQVVLDLEEARYAKFYNLEGKSFSNSLQAEMEWSPIKRLDWRLAYRWLEVRTQYTSGLLDKPLVNRHRAFTNIAYETRAKTNGAQWRFDATLQWISKKRIPITAGEHPHGDQVIQQYSQDYFLLNSQVTYVFKKNVELYVGVENITNFMVHGAIVSAENPASENFDGSLLWGPVFGRMGYVGFRWIVP